MHRLAPIRRIRRPHARYLTENLPVRAGTSTEKTGELFVDSVFPVQLSWLDFRRYVGYAREDTLISTVRDRLSKVTTHGFKVVDLQPHHKEGGLFVTFTYEPGDDSETALAQIQADLVEETAKHGDLPNWLGIHALGGGKFWPVKGNPWQEDMARFPSPSLKVAFEGSDVHEQTLYKLFRPYGRIENITEPVPVPSGALRSSTVTFRRVRSASIAHNVLHGVSVPSGVPGAASSSSTRLRTSYNALIHEHMIRDWVSKHPKTFFPVIIFLLGTLTYTVFDPIRAFMVEGKLMDWFNVEDSRIYKWLRTNALGRSSTSQSSGIEMWKERKDAEDAVKTYLADLPTTVAFMHGPQGSGKFRMLRTFFDDSDRKSLVIDCRELLKAGTDSQLISALARQTGYWPVFSFLNSMNSLIDLASVGLIGQKAGLSTSLVDQVKGHLDVVATALKSASSSHRATIRREMRKREQQAALQQEAKDRSDRIRNGTFHDGRIDVVAGNGIMSELGFGDEPLWDTDASLPDVQTLSDSHVEPQPPKEEEKPISDNEVIEALPIVVIRNFESHTGAKRQDILEIFAEWAAALTENQVAHVIILSDNRENIKTVAKALPTKPLNSIALYDADAASSLAFVQGKLRDSNVDVTLTPPERSLVERLGGRASDLESLIHKVRAGQTVEAAVEDIISRGVSELRKNAFGDDAEDAKSLPWTNEQAWALVKLLAKKTEVPYYDVLLDSPFKGDETPLRNMEHAELISIGAHNGRPSTIRPGKPVFKWVFERLVGDKVFQATQDITYNDKQIASSETTIKACEQELVVLKEITPKSWLGTPTDDRAQYLLKKMAAAGRKIETLENTNAELKKVVARGG